MSKTTILILGGYGNTGSRIARMLLEHTDVSIVIGGRHKEMAEQAAQSWNAEFTGQRVGAVSVDAGDQNQLARAYERTDLVVVASAATQHARTIALAAMDKGIDYIDLQISDQKLADLSALSEQILHRKLCFITERPSISKGAIRKP